MILATPKTPGPYGLEPSVRWDFLNADECAGQGISLLPALTPPSVNQGLVLNGTTQYATARSPLANVPLVFSYYMEFAPTFAYTVNALYMAMDGDGASSRLGWYKHDNANSNRIHFLYGAVSPAYANGADYGTLWRQNQRNRLCLRATTGACAIYLNGSAVVTNNVAYSALIVPNYFYVGATYLATAQFPGTIYDVQIYPRLISAAEAIQLTTVP